MTEKQLNILNSALKLFARDGYANTSTNSIAKEAGVSEGLIFRHFKNKEGLLDAVIEMGMTELKFLLKEIEQTASPGKKLAMSIEVPLRIVSKNREFWKLQFSLKFQTPEIAARFHRNDLMVGIFDMLAGTFTQLGYTDPLMETKYLFSTLTGVISTLTQNEEEDIESITGFIKSKYGV